MIRSLCLVIFILTNSITIAQNLVINEFMSSNNGFLLDEDEEDNDWIEIYNNSANSINLNDFDYAINKENEERHGTNPGATIVLRKLMENEMFEKQFFARLEYLLKNQLSKNATLPVYNDIISLISNDIHHQIQRFDDLPNYDTWLDLMNTCRNFLLHRSCIIQTQVKKEFDIQLNISNCESMPPMLQDFRIIPNPHTGNFKLSFNADNSMPSKILITNSLGQVLKIENKIVLEGDNEILFHALDLPNGILFIAVVIENQIFRAKMIKLDGD